MSKEFFIIQCDCGNWNYDKYPRNQLSCRICNKKIKIDKKKLIFFESTKEARQEMIKRNKNPSSPSFISLSDM